MIRTRLLFASLENVMYYPTTTEYAANHMKAETNVEERMADAGLR